MKRTPMIARSLLAVIVLLAPGALWAGEGKIRRSPAAVKNEYIVVLNDDTPRDKVPGLANRLAKQHGGELKRVWQDALKGFFVRMSEGQAQGLSHHPDVKYIEENAEMFFSTTVPTNIDPACVPGPGQPCTTTDNRLWHLDMLDQSSAVGNNEYSYCETGDGVYVYVVDQGVMRAHKEFGNDAAKVLDGYDATGDPPGFPAHNPCGGPGLLDQPPDGQRSPSGVRSRSHGTGVASLINGQSLGVARNAKIVPIKMAPCAQFGVRKLNEDTPFTFYATDEIVLANGTYYGVTVGGFTGSTSTFPHTNWPSSPPAPSCCQTWGDVELEWLGASVIPTTSTVQMTIEGLDWIVRPSEPDANGNFPAAGPGSPYPKSPAVVTLSTYRVAGADGVSNTPAGSSLSLEDAIGNLLNYNGGHGITVIASANNQDANACDTSPGRMSRNNPNDPNDPDRPYKVITAGGTMLRNNPDSNPATGGLHVGAAEPMHDDTKPTVLARWRCHAGDSDNCSTDIYDNPAPTPDPTDPAKHIQYSLWTLGSNGGQCVTLFAPAKNIPVANIDDFDTYRNSRATGGVASGTSWSAPIVAAMAARILQSNPGFTVDQVYDALMSRTAPDLDPNELNPPSVTGTPNAVLRLTPVVVQPLPTITPAAPSGNATITVTASGPAGLTYELHQVHELFDVAQYNKGAASVQLVQGPQTSNTFSVPATGASSYFVRVRSSCGTADTNITSVTSISAPLGVVATAAGGTVTISWNAAANASGYKVERKIGSGAWTLAQTVTNGSTTSATDSPTVPARVVLYRVRATQGSADSDPSSVDVAYVNGFTDDPIVTVTPFTVIKAVHLVEMRQAVNALRELGGSSAVYAGNDLIAASLITLPVQSTDFTTLLSNLNTARTAVGLPTVVWPTTPASGGAIGHMEVMRGGVR